MHNLSVIVVAYGGHNHVNNLLLSLRDHADTELIREIVIVDNGWPECGDARDHIEASRSPVPLIFARNPKRSYASGVNVGAQEATAQLLAVANSDVLWTTTTSVAPLVEAMRLDPELGIVGPAQLFPDGTPQRSHGPLPGIWDAIRDLLFVERIGRSRRLRAREPKNTAFVDGAFLVTRRACFDQIGGFDESWDFYGEDGDYCWRAQRAGWRCAWIPSARIVHLRGTSSIAVAPLEFLDRLARAKCRLACVRSGYHLARLYGWLLVASAGERLLLSKVASLVGFPTQSQRYAAHWVRACVRAARESRQL